jgi:hypothetical protein
MRIVLDMQGVQTENRFRGIGQYVMGFAKGVVRNRGAQSRRTTPRPPGAQSNAQAQQLHNTLQQCIKGIKDADSS